MGEKNITSILQCLTLLSIGASDLLKSVHDKTVFFRFFSVRAHGGLLADFDQYYEVFTLVGHLGPKTRSTSRTVPRSLVGHKMFNSVL